MFILVLPFFLLLLGMIFSGSQSQEKLTAFECGFTSMSGVRGSVPVKFILLVILFLLFDVELCLFFPVLTTGSVWFWIISLSILFFAILFEIESGMVQWFSL